MGQPRPLRAAIIGAGLMGRWHAEAARRAGAKITTVADNDPRRSASLARQFGARAISRLEDALSPDAADVVHVCTPSETHADLIRKALSARLHVLTEKPLTSNAGLTAELLALAESAKVLLCPVHQMLFQSGVTRMLEKREEIGPICQLAAVICSAGADGSDDRVRDRLAFDILPHPLSLAARIIPSGITGARWRASRPAAGEVQVIGSVGAVGIAILISTHGRPTRNTLRVTGEGGSWHSDLFHGFGFQEVGSLSRLSKLARPFSVAGSTVAAASDNLFRRALRTEPAFPGLRELVRQFYDAVRAGGQSPVAPPEALEVAAARDTIVTALRLDGALA